MFLLVCCSQKTECFFVEFVVLKIELESMLSVLRSHFLCGVSGIAEAKLFASNVVFFFLWIMDTVLFFSSSFFF